MLIGAWLVLMHGSTVEVGFDYRGLACITGDFLKVLNLRALALPSRLALNIGTWLKVMKNFKSSEFAGVGSTVEVGFDYRGLARSNRDFLKF